MNQNELKKELLKRKEEKEINKQIDKARKLARTFIENLINQKDFKFDCPHHSNLKHFFETDKEQFINYVVNNISLNFLRNENPEIEDIIMSSDNYCFNCDAWLSYRFTKNSMIPFKYNGKEFVDARDECYEVKEFSVEIAVPSGRIILVDWPVHGKETLCDLDVEENGHTASINSTKGTFLRSNKYAERNIMHFFVGNTSPSVYQKDEVIYIGKTGYSEEDDDIPMVSDSEYVGSVCTDLWWVTAFDYEIYKKLVLERIGENNELDDAYAKNEWGNVQLNVKPGVYKCTNYFDTLDRSSDKPLLYSKMEWVRDI